MGTRNVTVIINNGERVVRQYGQWDGYPTTALATICDTIRNHLDKLKENAAKCHLVNEANKGWSECIIGRRPKDIFDKICNWSYSHHFDYMSMSRKEQYDFLCKHFDPADVKFYLLNTRDTGYNIVEDIATIDWDDIPCQDCGTEEEDTWIEAVNIINLDEETICAKWHGKLGGWSFDALPTFDELKEFEEEEE